MTPDQILKDVSKEFGVPVKTILSPLKSKYVYKARCEVARRMRELGLSLTETGMRLNRDHTSVINMLKKTI